MINAEQVKLLREETDLSVIECKKALEKADGDFKKAKKYLSRAVQNSVKKRSSRQTHQGIVEAYVHSNKKVGAMIKLYCETDFVAKSKEFKDLAHDLAMQVVAANPSYLKGEDISSKWIREEKKALREEAQKSGKPKDIIEKIVEGKIQKQIQEICLYTQPFIKNPEQTVEDYIKEKIAKFGENIKVGEFVRFEI